MKIDLGCGNGKIPGFVGVDVVKTDKTDIVHDLFTFPWPFEDNSAELVCINHFFEHVPGKLRGKFMDELYRIMKPEAVCLMIVPYWTSRLSVQDFTHEWPPVCETSFLYFNKKWREENRLSHYGLNCNFEFTYAYRFANEFMNLGEVEQIKLLDYNINAVSELHINLIKV